MLRPALRTRHILPLLRGSASAPPHQVPLSFNCQYSKSTHDKTSDRIPTNDPQPAKNPPNVSASNALPISPKGLHDEDKPLQELPEDGERRRVMQAPNRAGVWSRSQQPRERAMSGPRFEQTIMAMQVRLRERKKSENRKRATSAKCLPPIFVYNKTSSRAAAGQT